MLRTIVLALPFAVLAVATLEAAGAETLRRGTTLKRTCLSETQITAQLKRRGLHPVEKLSRRGNTYSVLARRGGSAGETGARVVVDSCSGKILQINKAVLPNKFKLRTICKSKAAIIAQFDAAGYYHIQVEGPMKLTPPAECTTTLCYAVRAWTKKPPQCPWNFSVRCTDGAILTQYADAC